jgi:hypothetical protein
VITLDDNLRIVSNFKTKFRHKNTFLLGERTHRCFQKVCYFVARLNLHSTTSLTSKTKSNNVNIRFKKVDPMTFGRKPFDRQTFGRHRECEVDQNVCRTNSFRSKDVNPIVNVIEKTRLTKNKPKVGLFNF